MLFCTASLQCGLGLPVRSLVSHLVAIHIITLLTLPSLEDDVRLATLVYSLFGASALTLLRYRTRRNMLTHIHVKVAASETS